MAYTDSQLAIVCPKCRAAIGGKCLDPIIWGSKYASEPHLERIKAAEHEQ